jgi:hypothetical protein
MAFLESKDKGKIPVGVVAAGAPGFGVIVPGTDGHVLTVDSTSPTGWKTASAAPDPRDVFRFSMIHNVGVTGGG